jgi:hypothetical protein
MPWSPLENEITAARHRNDFDFPSKRFQLTSSRSLS